MSICMAVAHGQLQSVRGVPLGQQAASHMEGVLRVDDNKGEKIMASGLSYRTLLPEILSYSHSSSGQAITRWDVVWHLGVASRVCWNCGQVEMEYRVRTACSNSVEYDGEASTWGRLRTVMMDVERDGINSSSLACWLV